MPRPASGPTGRRLRSLVFTADSFADIRKSHFQIDFVTFVCIVIFIFKLKADHGQSRMTRLMRAILGDGTLYFFVMVGFHVAMALFTVFSRVINLPLLARRVLMSWHSSPPFSVSRRLRLYRTYSSVPIESAFDKDPPV